MKAAEWRFPSILPTISINLDILTYPQKLLNFYQIMAEPLKVYKALADETRLRLMRLLSRGPLNVNEVIGIMQMGQSRVSRHLKILAEAGLVTGRRQGTWIYYEAAPNGDGLVADTLTNLNAHEKELGYFSEDVQRLEASTEGRRQRTRAYFDSLRDPSAFLQHPSLNGDYYRELAASLLPRECATVLDMGTGSGLLLPHLLERSERVIAVDSSATMLDLAKKAVGQQLERCDFRLGDLEHLPVADGEVESVMACMVLHHISRPADVLAEAYRALTPGGTVVIVDLNQHQDESLRERLADLWLGFEPTQVKRWLKKANFELVEWKTIVPKPEPILRQSTGDKARASVPADPLKLITFKGQKP